MKIHELKTDKEFFLDIASGRKGFELRKDDRGIEKGDILLLREYDAEKKKYTGRVSPRQVAYILKDFKGIEPGYVIMSLRWLMTSIDSKLVHFIDMDFQEVAYGLKKDFKFIGG